MASAAEAQPPSEEQRLFSLTAKGKTEVMDVTEQWQNMW